MCGLGLLEHCSNPDWSLSRLMCVTPAHTQPPHYCARLQALLYEIRAVSPQCSTATPSDGDLSRAAPPPYIHSQGWTGASHGERGLRMQSVIFSPPHPRQLIDVHPMSIIRRSVTPLCVCVCVCVIIYYIGTPPGYFPLHKRSCVANHVSLFTPPSFFPSSLGKESSATAFMSPLHPEDYALASHRTAPCNGARCAYFLGWPRQ